MVKHLTLKPAGPFHWDGQHEHVAARAQAAACQEAIIRSFMEDGLSREEAEAKESANFQRALRRHLRPLR